MTSAAFSTRDTLGPVLVSELPALTAPARPRFLVRFRGDLTARREARAFERAVRQAGPSEHGDLLAMRLRD